MKEKRNERRKKKEQFSEKNKDATENWINERKKTEKINGERWMKNKIKIWIKRKI